MKYEIKGDEKNHPNKNGIVENSNGGTEQMFRKVQSIMTDEQKNDIQLICSRVREIEDDKIPILWCHDTWNDPENVHLSDENSRKRFKKIIFVSNYQFQTFRLAHGVRYNESLVFPNAIEPFSLEINKPNPNEELRLIYHTTPHRGLEILIPVFEQLASTKPNLHLDVFSSFEIYGWRERDEPYKPLFERCQNHPQITYHGYQPNSVVREYLKKAHIFAYPNIWNETSCIAAIEAMAAGCAVLAPDFGALPETLNPFGVLYRFDENIQNHANQFYGYLDMMTTNFTIMGNMEQRILSQMRHANSYYGWDFRKKQWIDFFETLIPEKKVKL